MLRICAAGGSTEVDLVAKLIASLVARGTVSVTYDWTRDVIFLRPEAR